MEEEGSHRLSGSSRAVRGPGRPFFGWHPLAARRLLPARVHELGSPRERPPSRSPYSRAQAARRGAVPPPPLRHHQAKRLQLTVLSEFSCWHLDCEVRLPGGRTWCESGDFAGSGWISTCQRQTETSRGSWSAPGSACLEGTS